MKTFRAISIVAILLTGIVPGCVDDQDAMPNDDETAKPLSY